MYVIKRIDAGYKGKYVAKHGTGHSYTSSLEHAQKFATRENAEGNRCPDNECVVDVNTLL